MADGDRAQWITILEAASVSPPDELNAEWEWLMKELGLPLDRWLAVREAIQQGRWRTAKNPRGYVKKVAKREAVKLGLVESMESELVPVPSRVRKNGIEVPQTEVLGELFHALKGSEAVKGEDGIWRRGSGTGDYRDREGGEYEFDSAWDYLLSKLPDDLKLRNEPPTKLKEAYDRLNAFSEDFYHMRSPFTPNWKAWGLRAGLDEWEQLALECRVFRKSREKALVEQPDEASRKALQAAWKRFDRTGMERLANALK